MPVLSRLIVVLYLVLVFSGCQSLSYYGQAAGGQMRLVVDRKSVAKLLTGPITPELRGRLEFSQEALDFISKNLGLTVANRYQTYVDLHRDYVLWNLFVAPEFAIQPRRWCYPIVGCAAYRGYFSEKRARQAGMRFSEQGHDVWLSGVAAYSTLGWFDDSLLSSFIDYPNMALFKLLAHELAHSEIWVPGEIAFNEAFATFVGEQGTHLWRIAEGFQESGAESDYTKLSQERQRALDLLLRLRARLHLLYKTEVNNADKRSQKATLIAASRECYRKSRDRFQGYFEGSINNARLSVVSRYWQLVPWFAKQFDLADEQWPAFYARVAAVVDSGKLPKIVESAVAAPIACPQLLIE